MKITFIIALFFIIGQGFCQSSSVDEEKVLIEKEVKNVIDNQLGGAINKAEKEKLLQGVNEIIDDEDKGGSKKIGEEVGDAKKTIGKAIDLVKKKTATELEDDPSNGSALENLPVAILGADESIEDYLIEQNKIRKAKLLRRRYRFKSKYSLEDQAAYEFRRRYKKLYWKRYRNKRWEKFVKEHWVNFKKRYISAITKTKEFNNPL